MTPCTRKPMEGMLKTGIGGLGIEVIVSRDDDGNVVYIVDVSFDDETVRSFSISEDGTFYNLDLEDN